MNQFVSLLIELFKWRSKSTDSKQHKEVANTLSESAKQLKTIQDEHRQEQIELEESLKSGKRNQMENDW